MVTGIHGIFMENKYFFFYQIFNRIQVISFFSCRLFSGYVKGTGSDPFGHFTLLKL